MKDEEGKKVVVWKDEDREVCVGTDCGLTENTKLCLDVA